MAQSTAAKMAYIRKWNEEHTKTFCIRLNAERDADIIAAIESSENKADYIRTLIRKDIGNAPMTE